MGRILDAGRVFVKDGKVAAAGTASFFASGTATKKLTYSDAARKVENTNPITLNADGELPVEVFGSGAYTVTVKDVNGGAVWSEDNVSSHDAVGLTYTHSATGLVRSIEDRLRVVFYASDYVKMDGTTDDTTAWQALLDAVPSKGAIIEIGAGTSILSAQITLTNKPITIRGGGISVSTLKWTSAATTRGLKITQDVDTYHTEVSSLSFTTLGDAASTGLIVNMAGQISSGTIQGRVKSRLILRDLEFRGDTNISTDAWNWGFEGVSINHGIIDHCVVFGKKNSTVYTNTSAGGFHISGAGSPTIIQFTKCYVFYGLDGVLAENYEGVTITDCNFITTTRGVKYTDSDSGSQLFSTILNTHFNTFENAVVTTGGMTALQMNGCYMVTRSDGNPSGNFTFLDLDEIQHSRIVDCSFSGGGFPGSTVTGIHFKETTGTTQNNYVVRPILRSLDTGIKIDSGVSSTRIEDPFYLSTTTELNDASLFGTALTFSEETKFKIADQEVVSSTAFVSDTEMQKWRLDPHSYYKIDGSIKCDTDSSAVPDIKFRITTDFAFQASACSARRVTVSGATAYDYSTDFSGTAIIIPLLATDPAEILISGWVHTHATANGNVAFTWSQNTSNATRTRLRPGSRITFTKMGSDT